MEEQQIYIEPLKLPAKKRGPKLKIELTPEMITSVLEDSLVHQMKYLDLSIKYCLSYQQIKNIEAKYGEAYRERLIANSTATLLNDYWNNNPTSKKE